MIVDGIGTMIASFFGSPFGTVVYIGHPAHKKSGALTGYSLTNGIIYLFLSWFGILALMQSIVNQATIGPIVLFVGLMVNEEALNFIPPRHYAAYIIGLFPSIYDWVVNIAGMSPISGLVYGENINLPGLSNWFGVLAWRRGALLVSFVWVATLVQVIDRHWFMGAIWACIAAGFSLFGIIHVPEAGFENFNSPVWEQCDAVLTGAMHDNGTVVLGPDGQPERNVVCWEYAEQWMFFVAYIMLAATFGLIGLSRKYGGDPTLLPRIVDEKSEQVFRDWFADAGTDTSTRPWRTLEEQEAELAGKKDIDTTNRTKPVDNEDVENVNVEKSVEDEEHDEVNA
jgi:AGZA family xanthine/uracil permease-like MFS transporter